MIRRLPPLNSLRAFEAAARHRSMSEAARELFVTHGAVGRHVAKLEQFLGAELFVRENNRLTLTAQGEAYAARLTGLFDQIQTATTEHFAAASRGQLLRIGSYPTFANQVLIPRLARFCEEFPDIPFQIQTSQAPPDPNDGEVDVAIWLGTGDWPGLVVRRLFGEELLPVVSPRLMQGKVLTQARDVAQFTLLHALPRPDDWQHWFALAGVKDLDAHRGMHFEHSSMVVQAALNQLGVAMAQTAHVRDDIDQGRLQCLFDLPLRTERSYYLVHATGAATDPRVAAFARWIAGELAVGV